MFNMYNRRYTGSKYKLMEWIRNLIIDNCKGKTFFDVFAGTGVVTEYMINDYEKYIINDFLYSNEVIYKGFLLKEDYDMDKLIKIVKTYNKTNKTKLKDNYVSTNFGDKYFNKYDAKLIGKIREELETSISKKEINSKEYYILLSSLLFSIDKIANTCGHYDAYRKIDNIESKFKYELILPKQLKDKQKIVIFCLDTRRNIKMSCKLSSKAKELLSKRIGLPYEKLIQMEDEEIEAYIEQKTGKKITWPKGAKVERRPIRTMEDIDKRIDEWDR